MQVWVGLGNDGEEYEGTRHNAGSGLLDFLTKALSVSFASQRDAYIARYEGLYLVKLKTHMNISGLSLAPLMRKHSWDASRVMIVHDELDLALGALRLQFDGGDGGHRGVMSIHEALQSGDFWRLRIGVRGELPTFSDKEKKTGFISKYMLSSFGKAERTIITEVYEWVLQHMQQILANPHKAMNVINRKNVI